MKQYTVNYGTVPHQQRAFRNAEWTNYATWRVNRDVFERFNVEKFSGHPYDSAYRLALDIEDWAYDVALGGHDGLVADYARAFMSQVNWCEIASHILENQDMKETE